MKLDPACIAPQLKKIDISHRPPGAKSAVGDELDRQKRSCCDEGTCSESAFVWLLVDSSRCTHTLCLARPSIVARHDKTASGASSSKKSEPWLQTDQHGPPRTDGDAGRRRAVLAVVCGVWPVRTKQRKVVPPFSSSSAAAAA
eukprot:6206240-Pleurochrysis_carterae.AAC.2